MENIIDENDDVYVLGDFFLGTDYDAISQILKDLPGKIHLIIDSHDTDKKLEFYSRCSNITEITMAKRLKIGKNAVFESLSDFYRK